MRASPLPLHPQEALLRQSALMTCSLSLFCSSEAFQAYFNSNVHDTGRSSESESCSACPRTSAPCQTG